MKFILYTVPIFLSTIASAQIQFINTQELGKLLGYPAEKIRATDWTEVSKKKTPHVISSFLYEGEGNTFARIAVVIAEQGTLLTEKYESEIRDSIRKATELNLPQVVSRVPIGDDGYGYTGLTVMGSGGSQESVLGTSKQYGYDFRVTVTLINDPPLEKLPSAESYFDLIMGKEMPNKILELATHVSRFNPKDEKLAQANRQLPSEKPPERPRVVPTPLPTPAKETTTTAVVQKPEPTEKSWWLWFVSIPVLLLLFLLIPKRQHT